jgi:FtsX-like permease family
MAAVADSVTLPGEILAVDAAQAPGVVRLRGDQSPLPSATLFGELAPSAGTGGAALAGHPASVQLTATLSPAPLSPASAVLTVTDASGGSFQLPLSGTLPADGRPHRLSASLGGAAAAYPLRLTQLTVSYPMPEQPLPNAVTLTVTGTGFTGTGFTGWTAVASSPELGSASPAGPNAPPAAAGERLVPGGVQVAFAAGYGMASLTSAAGQKTLEPIAGQVTLTAGHVAPAAIPAIATKAFDDANHTGVGSTAATTINGITVPARIVAQVNAFPTITGPNGTGSALIMDLTTLQSYLAAHGSSPLGITQWWLATTGGRVPAALTAALPPGASVTSAAALAAAVAGDPLSAAPQQALLAMAAAAALLAITGFWVSIAANVRQRRAENALLAALGVAQRSAAAQLFTEKLLLSVPAAAFGLLLGTVVARLLVPAVTLSTAAQPPVPPAIALFDLPQTVPLAAIIAVLPALAAALVVFRRPDPAAELRAAEAA